MKKFMVRILCCFIPGRNNRHKIRHVLLDSKMNQTNENFEHHINNIIQNTINQDIFSFGYSMQAFINRNIEKKLSTALLHQKTFTKFKAIHTGQDIVILATGPSLNNFKPIKNAIYIGVNSAFKYDKVKLNYLFAQDYLGCKDYIDEMDCYQGNRCIKFYGLTTEFDGQWARVIPEHNAIKARALRYRTDWEKIDNFEPRLAYDISTTALGCFGSVVFPAIQFALWTNPKRIYLVGCDCSNLGHFDNTSSENLQRLIGPWNAVKRFVDVYYPATEIISVNPVGLRGLFTDLDQRINNEK